mmetsp:Transcript_32770/g.82552  ORF Transcript_32770/g.82552 Transcript_32770/m.82552 type:complete len:284 (-) Transcript_32770:608-1459(-)
MSGWPKVRYPLLPTYTEDQVRPKKGNSKPGGNSTSKLPSSPTSTGTPLAGSNGNSSAGWLQRAATPLASKVSEVKEKPKVAGGKSCASPCLAWWCRPASGPVQAGAAERLITSPADGPPPADTPTSTSCTGCTCRKASVTSPLASSTIWNVFFVLRLPNDFMLWYVTASRSSSWRQETAPSVPGCRSVKSPDTRGDWKCASSVARCCDRLRARVPRVRYPLLETLAEVYSAPRIGNAKPVGKKTSTMESSTMGSTAPPTGSTGSCSATRRHVSRPSRSKVRLV